jgi:hypothetical protein
MMRRSIRAPRGRRGGCRQLAVLTAIAMGASLSLAWAAESEHKSAAASTSQVVRALGPIFDAAGPPNFQQSIEAEFDGGGAIKVWRKSVSNLIAGIARMPFSERKLSLSDSEHAPCRLDGIIIAFFGGLQLASASGNAECGGTSSEVEGRLIAVTGIRGELFPLQGGKELSFTTVARAQIVALFPSADHRLSVVATLSGVMLKVTGAPDVIYLVRSEETPIGAKTLIVTDVYWSAGLRWPIQTLLRAGDGRITFAERNLLHVAGVAPYVLPDGRTVSTFDERVNRGYTLTEIDAITRALWRGAKRETTQDVRTAAEVMANFVDPTTQSSTAIDPAFAPIASFVTPEEIIP